MVPDARARDKERKRRTAGRSIRSLAELPSQER